MNNLKKAVAALTAIISMASLGAGTISASAADLDAINEKILNDTASDEEKFVAEYANDSEEMKIADYVINSDISLCDAESLMSSYEIGLANANFTETFSDDDDTVINLNTKFYSDSNLSKKQHYMVFISRTGEAQVRTSFDVTYSNKWIDFDENAEVNLLNNNSKTYLNFDKVLNDKTNDFYLSVGGRYVKENDIAAPKGFAEIPFNVVMKASDTGDEKYSEMTLRNKIKLNNVHNVVINGGEDTIFSPETYVCGDFDHDGKVTETDTMYVLKIVVGTYKGIKFQYTTGESNDYAKILTYLAADTNKDGDLTVADAVWMNQNRD